MVHLGPTETYSPRPGDIGITTISGWGGAGIKAAQFAMGCKLKTKQHAFTVTDFPDPDTCMIIEAMPGGARYVENWHPADQTVYLRCPDEFRDAVAASALTLKGVPYSWLDYEALALHHMRIPAPWLKTYISNTGHMICSQMADFAALDGGWHLFDDGRWPGYVPPCDLNRLYDKQVYA